MNTNERTTGAPAPGDPGQFGDRLSSERQSFGDAASSANEAISREAGSLKDEASKAASAQADKAKDAATSHLQGFAGALRAASDELSRNNTGPAAELVSHAASGLETLSRSIDGKSSGEMLDAVRRFGRENPLGFIAGSILAGFAVGRIASTATSSSGSSSASGREHAARTTSFQEDAS